MNINEFRQEVNRILLEQNGLEPEAVDGIANEDNLLATNIIDSFGFIDLCLAIEEFSGYEFDMGVLPMDKLTNIHALYLLTQEGVVPVTDEA